MSFAKGSLLQELNKLDKPTKMWFFLWKNKLKNTKTDYSSFTKEEFIQRFCKGNLQRFNYLEEVWTKTDEYEKLVYLMLSGNSINDLVEIFNIVRENAKKGDDKAIKTYLILQKEIKKNIKPVKDKDTVEPEDEDELILE